MGEGMPVPKIVHRLVDRFDTYRKRFSSPGYKEEWIRRDFIDPLFEASGWDIANYKGVPVDPLYEDPLTGRGSTRARATPSALVAVGSSSLKPRKPSVNLEGGIGPAFQLRRYAWTASLTLYVLTDFEELAIYYCRYRPKKDDSPKWARIDFITYEQYPDRLEEIASIFTRQWSLVRTQHRPLFKSVVLQGFLPCFTNTPYASGSQCTSSTPT